jgi:hypothetical protein
MKKISCLVVGVLFASQAHGFGTVSNAKIKSIRVDNDGRAMIFFDKPIGGEPAKCVHVAYKNALGIDASTDGGKAVLSMALTAKTTGSPVTAHGFGSCGVYGGLVIETWNHGFIN